MAISYEWIVEEVDCHGDVQETSALNSLAEAKRQMESTPMEGTHYSLGLTRNSGNQDEGILDRQWAYIENGILPKEFDGGAKVPKRFFNEVC